MRLGASGVIGAAGLWAQACYGDTFPPAAPAKPAAGAPALAERMSALVSQQCASCHKAEARVAKPGSIGAVYDLATVPLDVLARDPEFVRPGFPEASPLFQALMSRHRPTSLGPGGLSGDELLTVYDWISSLPDARPCASDARVEGPPPQGVERLRVSLGLLASACMPAGRLQEYRGTADDLLASLSRERPEFKSLDANGLLLEVDVDRLNGLTGADLEALRAEMANGPLPLERLAAFVLDRGLPVAPAVQPRVASLARLWPRDVDLSRAERELGIASDELRRKLSSLSGEAKLRLERLLGGSLPRASFEGLTRVLRGETATPPAQAAGSSIDVTLVTDQLVAKRGDLLTLRVEVDAPCHLTLVSIDTAGRALVLFPNEIEEANVLEPHREITIPGQAAGYQVRFDAAGTETVFALCQQGKSTLDGVKVDYEKQRFPVLGDWRGFLAVMDQRHALLEKERQSGDVRRSRRRGRSRGSDETEKPKPAAVDPKSNLEGFAALRIRIE